MRNRFIESCSNRLDQIKNHSLNQMRSYHHPNPLLVLLVVLLVLVIVAMAARSAKRLASNFLPTSNVSDLMFLLISSSNQFLTVCLCLTFLTSFN